MKQQLPRISESEWEVMKVLWANSPLTANQVVDALSDTTQWNPKTIKTLINRLVNKEAVGFTQEGRVYLYHPLIEKSECLREENKTFLQRVYGGALKPMLVNFLKEENLSKKDIEDLKQILEEREDHID